MIQQIKFRVANILSQLTKKINGPFVTGLLVENQGLHFLIEPTDLSVGRHLRFRGNYGESEQKKIEKLISKDSIVAFVGTHIGALAIPTSLKVKKSFLIEANPKTFRLLSQNITINSVNNAELFNIAAGEGEGEINFVLSKTNSGGSKREPKIKKHIYYYDNPDIVKVPMKAFDSLPGVSNETLDLVFVDIEGSEYFALKGMQKTLSRTKSLVIEFIGHHLRNVSGVSVEEFLEPIKPHFNYLYIPSTNQYVEKENFLQVLSEMYKANLDDEGIVFSKSKIVF